MGINTTISAFIILILAVIGLGYISLKLAHKFQSLIKPKTELRTGRAIKSFQKHIPYLTLDEKIFILELIIGTCSIYLGSEKGFVTIEGAGFRPSETNTAESARDITG
jgi:hypothetical protein